LFLVEFGGHHTFQTDECRGIIMVIVYQLFCFVSLVVSCDGNEYAKLTL